MTPTAYGVIQEVKESLHKLRASQNFSHIGRACYRQPMEDTQQPRQCGCDLFIAQEICYPWQHLKDPTGLLQQLDRDNA